MNRLLSVLLLSLFSATAFAQTIIVEEDFEDYETTAELFATWAANPAASAAAIEASFSLVTETPGAGADYNGDGNVDAADYVTWRKNPANHGDDAGYDAWRQQFGGPPSSGGAPNTYVFRDAPDAGVSPAGNLQYVPLLDPNFTDPDPNLNGSIFPTQGSEPIVLRADIFTPTSVIQRNTIGLRSNAPANLFEMGTYNDFPGPPIEGAAVAPTTPDCSTLATPACAGFAMRAVLFDGAVPNPNWQFFAFDPSWDTNANGLVTMFEVFAGLGIVAEGGWHTFEATFTPIPVEEGGVSGDVDVTVTVDLLRDGLNNAQNTEGVDSTLSFPLRLNQIGWNSLRIGGPSQLTSSRDAGFDNILLTGPLTSPGGGSAVPEPSALLLAALAVVGMVCRGRQERSA